MSYENKILQMKKMLGKKKASTSNEQQLSFVKPDEPKYVKQWESAGLEVVRTDYGIVFKRTVTYPLHYSHGNYELKQLFAVQKKWERFAEDHPYKTATNETLLFFDTETTGLKGTGTNIFLLGFLQHVENAFQLTQYVLADPANEVAFLQEGNVWSPEKTVVTYNGKSFDWPQLETRWTLNRQHLPKLSQFKHIDLLHSTKRIWKNDLDKMKLTAVEKEKLGFERVGDIPGFLAPVIYLDAVKNGDATSLMKVLKHNEWDLLSLVTLYIHSSLLLFSQSLSESSITYTNIGKWYGDLKDAVKGASVLENVTGQYKSFETGLAYFHLGVQQKKLANFEEAIQSFEQCISFVNIEYKVKASEQIAILSEHKIKDLQKAFKYTNLSLQYVHLIQHWTDIKKDKQLLSLTKRKIRLENKLREIKH